MKDLRSNRKEVWEPFKDHNCDSERGESKSAGSQHCVPTREWIFKRFQRFDLFFAERLLR